MKRLRYERPHKLTRLHEELLAAGIRPERVEGDGATCWLTVADAVDEAAVAAVVNAHDATAASSGERQMANRTALHARARAARAELIDLAGKIAAGTATAAERTRALELLCRATAALIRLELAELEASD